MPPDKSINIQQVPEPSVTSPVPTVVDDHHVPVLIGSPVHPLHVPHKPVDTPLGAILPSAGVASAVTPPSVPADTMVFSDLIPPPITPQAPTPEVFGETPKVGSAVPVSDVVTLTTPETPPQSVVGSPAPESNIQPPPPAQVEEEKLSVAERITKEEEHIRSLADRRKVIEQTSAQLFTSRKSLEDQVAPLLLDEKLCVERIESLEKKKHELSGVAELRSVEEDRWNEEEKRRAIEESKWPIGEKLEQVTQQIKEGELAFKQLLAEESQSTAHISKLRIEQEQQSLRKELEAITAKREASEEELAQFQSKREELTQLLRETNERDEAALTDEHVVDTKADTARTLYEERVLAEERRKLELLRREVEKKRWEAEDAIPGLTHSVAESEARLAHVKKEEAEVLAKLKQLGGS